MVQKFRFHNEDEDIYFDCNLVSLQCEANNKQGHQCGRRCVMGLPYCWTHLASVAHLKIKPSTIPEAGKGLFAWIPGGVLNQTVVFRKGETITEFFGEILTAEELVERYGHETAPYAARFRNDEYIDPACERCAASMANNARGTQFRNNASFSPDYRNNKLNIKCSVATIKHGQEIFLAYGNAHRMAGAAAER